MRRRSTFIHDPELDINPNQLVLSGNTFKIDGLRAAREERLIFGFNELPQELWQVLKQTHELHIRWAAQPPYSSAAPFVSRTSPGLHVFFTPLKKEHSTDLLCPLLHKIFSEKLKCLSPNTTFSSPPLVSSRFASTSSLQYHSTLSSLNNLVTYIQRKICPHSDQDCIHSASLLNIVDTLDLDYDSISHSLTLTAYWAKAPQFYFDPLTQLTSHNAWSTNIDAQQGNKVEVGILTQSKAIDAHELQLTGVLTVVGEDDHPKPTLFSFPSRHHPLPPSQDLFQRYSVSFQKPTGLHPTLEISFPTASALTPPTNKPDDSTCALHAYLTLPSALFADQYQLTTQDALFLSSHHLSALRSISGETDLEAPDYVVQTWGSNLLLELATPFSPPPSSSPKDSDWKITIPLHLRYLGPSSSSSSSSSSSTAIQIPWPVVFWACTADDGTKFAVNPFDRVNLGYDGLFGARTMFYHLTPAGGVGGGGATNGSSLIERIEVPVLNVGTESKVGGERPVVMMIEWGTVGVVILGFAWIVAMLWPGLMMTGRDMLGGKSLDDAGKLKTMKTEKKNKEQ